MALFSLAAQVDPGAWPGGGSAVRGMLAVAAVAGLLALFVWLTKRGTFGRPGGRTPVVIEGGVPLGERRSLVIVTVEGRRLLLGLTPVQVSLVTELGPSGPAFDRALDDTLSAKPRPS